MVSAFYFGSWGSWSVVSKQELCRLARMGRVKGKNWTERK
jgi:hypothetical protein